MTSTPAQTDSVAAGAVSREQVFPASPNLRFFGYSFRESGAAAAQFRIRDGTSAAGKILRNIVLVANQEIHEWFGPNGMHAPSGISVERVAGAADQSIQAAGG
jgi:hypothetical protein